MVMINNNDMTPGKMVIVILNLQTKLKLARFKA